MATNMRPYRFSPITSKEELYDAIGYVHRVCHQLCLRPFGRYLPVRGNVGIFAHYDAEYAYLLSLRDQLVDPAVHYKNKYFKLERPIVVPEQDGVPGATYEFLYIRRVDPYRPQVGDVDFVLPPKEHKALKTNLNPETFVNDARLFGRPEENMIELWNPDVDAVAYVATSKLRENLTAS